MRAVTLPPDETEYKAPSILEDNVFARDFWRADAERRKAAARLLDSLLAVPWVMTDREHELLLLAIRLDGMQITPARALRYYLKICIAIDDATVQKDA